MKILQVLPFFTPARGGSVIAPYSLSRELSKLGHEVTIITTDFEFNKEYARTLEKIGIKVIPFHCIVNVKLFLISPGMKKWLKENIKNFDVIHMHNFRSYQNSIVYKYASKYDIPYILQAHGSLPRITEKQGLKKLYDWVWGYRILKDATKVIALTPTEAEQYKSMGVSEDKIEIIPNGIDLAEFENLPPKGEFRQKYGLNDNEKVILYLGRTHQIKGIDLLVKAFTDLSKEIDDVKLVIVGPDDGYLPRLKKLIKELQIENKVLLTGPIYGKDKLKAYIDADVFVLPSVYETFPNTVIEACACGVPVVLTNRCQIADIIDGQAGLVVPYDKKELGKAIMRILNYEDLRQEFSERGKMLVREQFCWEKIGKRLEMVYESCLSSGY